MCVCVRVLAKKRSHHCSGPPSTFSDSFAQFDANSETAPDNPRQIKKSNKCLIKINLKVYKEKHRIIQPPRYHIIEDFKLTFGIGVIILLFVRRDIIVNIFTLSCKTLKHYAIHDIPFPAYQNMFLNRHLNLFVVLIKIELI